MSRKAIQRWMILSAQMLEDVVQTLEEWRASPSMDAAMNLLKWA